MTQVLQPTAKVVSASTRPQQMLHAVLSINNGIPQLREDSSAMMYTLARTACSGMVVVRKVHRVATCAPGPTSTFSLLASRPNSPSACCARGP